MKSANNKLMFPDLTIVAVMRVIAYSIALCTQQAYMRKCPECTPASGVRRLLKRGG